jgi:hypothetical protein
LAKLLDQAQDFGAAHGRKRGIGLVLLGFHFGHDQQLPGLHCGFTLSHFKRLNLAEEDNIA